MKRLAAFISSLVMLTSAPQMELVKDFAVQEGSAPTNPHKGWVVYPYSDWYFTDEYGVDKNVAWELSDVAYNRFSWQEIEPSRGEYDWSKIDH